MSTPHWTAGVDAPGDVEDSLVMCVLRDWHRGASGGEAVTVRIGRFDIESMMRSVLEVAAKAANCSEIPNSSTVDVEGLAKALADWWRDKDIQYSPASEEEAARRIVARDVERILRAHMGQPARGKTKNQAWLERSEPEPGAGNPQGTHLIAPPRGHGERASDSGPAASPRAVERARRLQRMWVANDVGLDSITVEFNIADEIRAAEQAVREKCEREWGEAMAELTRMAQEKLRAARSAP